MPDGDPQREEPVQTESATLVEQDSLRRRRFTVSEFHRLAEAGILAEHDRVELLAGEPIAMSPIGNPHATCVRRLGVKLAELQRRGLPSIQNPIRLDDASEPQPDVVVLRWRDDCYANAVPGPQDVLLLVEVCDSSPWVDRQVKLPLYAQAGVPEVWLVDLNGGEVLVHRRPGPSGYREAVRVPRGGRLLVPVEPPLELAAEDVLGPG